MSTCCETSDAPTTQRGRLTVALAGNPNSGKTTIFNGLTGLRQKVGNYPGVTVEKKTGRCKLADGSWVDIIDLPGTYSLISRSPDELVAMEVLRGLRKDTPPPDAVIVVVDASNLQRNLYLVSQLVELGRPMVVALNMMDIAERRGLRVSAERLSRQLGVPVIPIVGHKKSGIAELKAAIAKAKVAPLPDWPLPEVMREELLTVGGGLAILDVGAPSGSGKSALGAGLLAPAAGSHVGATPASPAFAGNTSTHERATQASPLQDGATVPSRAWICNDDGSRRLDRYEALAERLLIGDRAPDIASIASSEPVASLLSHANTRLKRLGIDPMQADIEAHYAWIEQTAAGSLEPACAVLTLGATSESHPVERVTIGNQDLILPYESVKERTLTEKVDRFLVHKVWGLLIFAGIMATLFVSIFWLAQPIMDALQNAVAWLGHTVTTRLPDGPIKALVNDGIFKGVGAVVVFVPQIALLFMFLAILEDSGYLARAAFLMDKLLAKVGLHGKSFIPLLSSFACAIPGIMATRTIDSKKDRLATILVAPFMSCSARLPVYTLLIGTFFARYGALGQAGIMLACYALGILAAVGMALIFKRTLLKTNPSTFILEMPTYKLPQLSVVARQVWSNSKAFLTKAGTTIFCLSVILWAMAYYPRLPETRTKDISDRVSAAYDSVSASGRESFADTKSAGFDAAGLSTSNQGRRKDNEPLVSLRMEQEGNGPIRVEPSKEECVAREVAAAQSEYSFSGRLGKWMEPAIRPLGFDRKIGVGLVGAFAAREVFVSTMGIAYSAGEVEDDTRSLSDKMMADRYTTGPKAGQPVWTPLVAVSLLIWFVLAMQCMSTIAIVRRETGGWGWPMFLLVYMNVLAYAACFVVYQVGTRVF